jgi:hypothetical protein
MKNIIRISTLLLIVTAIMVSGCKNTPKSVVPVTVEPTKEQLIQKGEYLVTIMGCNDCHSPKQMGPQGPALIPETMLSGYPSSRPLLKADAKILKLGWMLMNEDLTTAVGPWGESFSANITSDQTGIGNWTIDMFKRAFTQGKYMGQEGGRMLLPPMPWTSFVNIKEEDLQAIFTYLQSTKAVKNVVPLPIAPGDIK